MTTKLRRHEAAAASGERVRLRLYLHEPEAHVHLSVHGRCSGEVLMCRAALVRTPGEGAEAEVAVSDEGTHAVELGDRERLAVVSFSAPGLESVGMAGDVTEEVQRMGREARMARRELDRAVGQPLSLVGLAEQQSGPAQRMVRPGEMRDDIRRCEAPGDLLAQ